MCDKLRIGAIRHQHGDGLADDLVQRCAKARQVALNPLASVCVEGCDVGTLCGIPATLKCSATSKAEACDITQDYLFGGERWTGLPRVFRVATGCCLHISPSESSWPVCRVTGELLRLLSAFPETLTLHAGGLDSQDAPLLASWDLTLRPGRYVTLPVPQGALPRPKELEAQVYTPPVRVPCFYTHTTSMAPLGSPHQEGFVPGAPAELTRLAAEPVPAHGTAITIASAAAALGALSLGANIAGLPDPGAGDAVASSMSAILRLDERAVFRVRQVRAFYRLVDGSTRLWFRDLPAGQQPALDPHAVRGEMFWFGLLDLAWAADAARQG
jgi:hypothetical protein